MNEENPTTFNLLPLKTMTSSPAIRTFRSSQLTIDQHTHHKKPIMKPSIRSLFTLFFLFFATFTFRQLFTRPIIWVTGNFVLEDTHLVNDGFVKFAEVDLGEVSLRQNVEQLVGGDFRTAKRSFLSAGRVGRNVRGNGFLDLRSPEFSKLRLEVRKGLQDWFLKRRFSANVMSKMGRKYRSCAVVGNSGILLKSEMGREIDKHEFVIRLNNARIGGFEKFVGSKTGLSFMNSNILHLCSRRGGCFCHPYGENVPIMMYMSQPVHFLDYAVCNSTHKVGLMITDPGLDVLCARIVKYYSVKRFVKETGKSLEEWSGTHGGAEFHYSSGMQAVMFALGVCDKVSIFGFGKSDTAKHHYHTNQKTELSLHDYQAEYDLYEDLVKSPQNVPFISDEFNFPTVVIHR